MNISLKPCLYALTAMLSLSMHDVARAACNATTPVALTLAGNAQKQVGDSLSLDYCLSSGSAADLYAAITLPDTSLYFLTAGGGVSKVATPFQAGATSASGTLFKLDALPATLPLGTYTFYAAAVSKDGNILNQESWLGKSLVSSSVTLSAKPAQASAFFYQTVSPAASIVRSGVTTDGSTISTYGVNLVNAKLGSQSYADATFSRLANGRWAMTAWTLPNDSRGTGLFYHEASCPQVVDANVRVISASSASGCNNKASTAAAKTSQIFQVDGSNYLFSMNGGELYLTRLTDSSHSASDLKNICVRQTAAKSFAELLWGESTLVLPKSASNGLLLSDSAIARRKDGTWVLFVKGIASGNGCAPGSLCELCARNIYRATSTDLITWTSLEKVVSQASVPDAVTYPDGSVWLYYQNFAPTCSSQNLKLAERAPISGLYEGDGYALTGGVNVKFSNETFESNTAEHYPTNGNPIALPDAAAKAALDSCMGTSSR